MGYITPKIKRLRKLKYSGSAYSPVISEFVIKSIIEDIINKVSDKPDIDIDNVYLEGYEDGYVDALDRITKLLLQTGVGVLPD